LKDWERYDVSRYVDPGCVSPEEGIRSVPVPEREKRFSTIGEDLERLTAGDDLAKAIFLFHAPPYRTKLDVSSGEGKMIDHVPVDIHLGSIAIRRFIEARQPLLTLHGHAHEAARVSGSWRDRIGRTRCLSAAHDGPELALVRFDLNRPDEATRELI
jgi:Icc-related predicted phosphoesterase